ncbi:MAG: AsmA family protein, partial [Alphaproteobacteria bacterium]
VTVGQIVAQGATSLNAKLELPDAGAKARFGGAVSRHPDGVSLRGRLKMEGGNLAAAAVLLAGPGAGSGILAQPFAVETEVSVDLQQATASELVFRLGDTEVEGEVRVKLGAPLDVRINLSAPRLDLDKLLAAGAADTGAPAGQQPATAPASGQAGGQPAPGSGPALPTDVSATVELNVDALVYHRQVVRQILVSISLANGQLRVSQALALLPGGSDVSVTGVLAPAKATAGPDLRFIGRVEAASDNLRGMLQWLGVEVASVPPDRLRRMSLSAKFDAGASQATVSDIDLRVDVSRVTGGIAMVLRERPGFGIGLAVDKLNLDAYLPREGTAVQEGEASQETPAAVAAGTAGLGTAGPLAVLAGFDANLDLTMGSLSVRGVTARKLRLDATLKRGAVVLREMAIGDLAGSKVRLSGTLSDLVGTPSIAADFALSVPDPGKLAKLAGQDAATLARIGPFELTGSVMGTLEKARLDTGLTALGGRFGAAGTVQPLASPMGFDLKLVAKHPDLAQLARALGVEPPFGRGLGGVDLALGLRGTPAQMEIAGLTGDLGPATLSGGFAADLSGPAPVLSGVDLGVAVRHSDLGGLIKALSPGAAVGEGLGGVDLKGRITGGAKAFQIVDLSGRLGAADISGRLGADISGTKPALDIELTTGELPLAALMAAGGTTSSGAASSGTGSGARSGRWSTDPIDASGLNAVNAEVKLNALALLLDDTRLDRVSLEASLVDGELDLRKFNSTVYGGALAITGKVDVRKTLEVGLAVTAIELDLARLLHDLAESDRVSGPLNFNASLSTRGRNEAELVAALSGGGKLDGTLRVKTKQEERVGSQLLGIAGALLGQKIKEFDQIRGLTDATNVLFNAFADAPAAVTGSFTVDRGVVITDDLRVDGQKAVALTQARADLPRWLLDSQTSVFLAADPDQPYVTVGLRGPLDAPNPRLSGVPLRSRQQLAPATGPAPSTGPAPTTSGQVQTAPQIMPQPAPETAQPEDLLRQGVEQGLKKLFGN